MKEGAMKKICMDLENCFGIKKMKQEIDFSQRNVSVLYAPNGTMKSSLAKTFDCISKGENVEERVFGYKSSYEIMDEFGNEIMPESIMVINPFDKKDCDNQGLLMANEDLRKKYLKIHKNIDDKKDKLFKQIKTQLGYASRSGFDVEANLLVDWDGQKNKLFESLEEIQNMLHNPEMSCSISVQELDYNLLFNDKVCSMMSTDKTAELIEEYEKKYAELIENSLYMQRGIIDHNNYANIGKSLNENGFFNVKNEITLKAKDGSGNKILTSYEELNSLMLMEKERVLNTKELKTLFDKINKSIDKNKETRMINAFLQNNPEIVIEYKNIQIFKKKIWIKVFGYYELELIDLLKEYRQARGELALLRESAKKETTEWNKVLELFKERFFVPFNIKAANQEDVILNMDMPSFKYIFTNPEDSKEIVKEKLLEVLSTGEERAYYILNMLFQIVLAQKEGKEKLIILDDISESFDYKNKYAIVEYLNDISQVTDEMGNKIFKLLILTHNFDFYRTISSRLYCSQSAYIAYVNNGEICFDKSEYTRTLFLHYKKCIRTGKGDKYIVATVPFVRNLIEYIEDDEHEDYIKLTSILHYKPDTKIITIKEIEDIYNTHWCHRSHVNFSENREESIFYDIILAEAEKIGDEEKLEIENKLILSMAIRLKTEKYIINELTQKVQSGKEVVDRIYEKKNQTGNLIRAYKEHFSDEKEKVLEQVAMLTSENIHLNSFMFEPILDMSIKHLYDLYQKIKDIES